MDQSQESLFDLVSRHHRPESFRDANWVGSFREYLEIVEARPEVARNAWGRLIDMIESHGSEPAKARGGPKRWRLFDDPFTGGQDAVFGLDESRRHVDTLLDRSMQALRPLGTAAEPLRDLAKALATRTR